MTDRTDVMNLIDTIDVMDLIDTTDVMDLIDTHICHGIRLALPWSSS